MSSTPRVALLGLPYDASSSFMRGPAEAPAAIRAALDSPSANRWSELGVEIGPATVKDLGDAKLGQASVRADIEAAAKQALDQGYRLLALGGDHSVSYPLLRAHAQRYGKGSLTLVHFDAHADLYEDFEGDRYSHACPFARIMEEGLVARLVQIGIRTQSDHLRAQVERFGVEVIEMRELARVRALEVEGPTYLSFDLDALDPAFAPGVSHHEPGGMSTREALDILHRLGGELVGADLVELNPRRDLHDMSAMVAAKLVKEIAAKLLSS